METRSSAHWMQVALGEARAAATEGEVPVGAVIVLEGQEVARGHNRPIGDADPTAHAEVAALRAAARRLGAYRLPGVELYVTLEPCAMCMGAMVHARVSRVIFAAADPKSGAAGSVLDLGSETAFNHRIEVVGPTGPAEAGELLRSFFRDRRG